MRATATFLLFGAFAATAAAQEPPSADLAAEAAEGSPSASPAAEVASPPAGCFPACRSGFVCHEARCISACNPLCESGLSCTAEGECVAPVPLTPAGSLPAPAPEPAEPPTTGVHAHDGFMLRLSAGMGGGAGRWDDGDGDLRLTGVAGSFAIDLGGAVARNFILHFRFITLGLTGNSSLDDGPYIDRDDAIATVHWALGATYYFMPNNIYLTGSVGLAGITHIQDEDVDGRAGVGFTFDVGKEWWVSDNWGLGIAGRLMFAGGKTSSSVASQGAAAVLFSATYQ